LNIEHRPGRLHSNADALSHHKCKQCFDKNQPVVWIDECKRADEITEPISVHAIRLLPELTSEDIALKQAEDTEIGPVYNVLADNTDLSPDDLCSYPSESRQLLARRPQVLLQDGMLVRQMDERTQLVVPTDLRKRLFDVAHVGPLAAHLGSNRMTHLLQQSYYWPGMNRDIDDWCRQCE